MDIRVGQGYDSHKLVEGRSLILGGVSIPHDKGLLGHSDADVLIHAVIDALLGAAALGDIGRHFPDSDPAYKGISSVILLKKTIEVIKNEGYEISNIDATVIAEEPKLSPHIDSIQSSLAKALGLEKGRISVKAKSNEGLDATGRKEAIAVHAVALIQR